MIIVWQLETAGPEPLDDIGSVERWRAAKILRRWAREYDGLHQLL